MYGELIIGLNMMFNFTILSFANKIQQGHIQAWRLLLASFIGAIMIMVMSSGIMSLIIVFISMTIIAYGTHFFTWRKFAMTFLLGAIFAGGLLTVIQERIFHFQRYGLIILLCGFLYMILGIVKRKLIAVQTIAHTSSLTQTSSLSLWERQIPLVVFIDSGNQCEEPLSGKPVHFIAYDAVKSYMPEPLQQLFTNWDKEHTPFSVKVPESFQHQLRLIKIITVQGEQWVMGLQYKKWRITAGNLLEEGYIVFTMDQQHYPNDADAILHVSAMRSIH